MTGTPLLDPTEYEILSRFADGEEPPTIAEGVGKRLMDVATVLNKAKRSRARARELVNGQTPPTESQLTAPLPSVVVRSARPAPEVPARLREEPVPDAPTTATQRLATKVIDDAKAGIAARSKAAVGGNVQTIMGAARPEVAITISGNPDQVREGVALVAEATRAAAPIAGLPNVDVDDLDSLDGVAAAGRAHPEHAAKVAEASEVLAAVRRALIAERRRTAVLDQIAEHEAAIAWLRELVA